MHHAILLFGRIQLLLNNKFGCFSLHNRELSVTQVQYNPGMSFRPHQGDSQIRGTNNFSSLTCLASI
jgi:hypothetical protein